MSDPIAILTELDKSFDPICAVRHDDDLRLGVCQVTPVATVIISCKDMDKSLICETAKIHIDRARAADWRFICHFCGRPASMCWLVGPL